jgi:hypothetical protein
MTIQPKTPTGSEVAGTLALAAKNSVLTNGTGGAITFLSGDGTGTGAGGNISFTAGRSNGTNNGGNISFSSGINNPNTGTGGNLNFTASTGLDGGGVAIQAGNGSRNGGDFTATAGNSSLASGVGGGFKLFAGNNGASLGSAGSFDLRSGTAVGGNAGDMYFGLGFGGINPGSILFTGDPGTAFRITTDAAGSSFLISFFGVAPAPQQSATTLAEVITALQAYGLLA